MGAPRATAAQARTNRRQAQQGYGVNGGRVKAAGIQSPGGAGATPWPGNQAAHTWPQTESHQAGGGALLVRQCSRGSSTALGPPGSLASLGGHLPLARSHPVSLQPPLPPMLPDRATAPWRGWTFGPGIQEASSHFRPRYTPGPDHAALVPLLARRLGGCPVSCPRLPSMPPCSWGQPSVLAGNSRPHQAGTGMPQLTRKAGQPPPCTPLDPVHGRAGLLQRAGDAGQVISLSTPHNGHTPLEWKP